MNQTHLILVKALNELIEQYNNKAEGINFIDVRNFENYIVAQGIIIAEVNEFLNIQK